ncbi:transcriptional regulator GutM [Caenibacillus caldisaponilyticus]|uniref:transcriptional regulator GutM n=1 Tax=Caenibacillus caldisaponilyticus TaxID=1674942 RepID=UPI001EE70FAA|nr:transcriptional regulator GutM [Caenibacillus caldisaponilyticus]
MLEMLELAIFIGGAFIIQQLLGFIQIKHFTKEYVKLRKIGKVAIGRRPGKLRAGAIVMFAINQAGKILEAKKLQGVTILARMKKLEGFEGKYLNRLTSSDMVHCNKPLRMAIEDAKKNYRTVITGGTIPEKPSPLKSILLKAEKMVVAKKS